MFTSSTKRRIRKFLVVVVQEWLGNVPKACCTCTIVVLLSKLISFFDVPIAVAVVASRAPFSLVGFCFKIYYLSLSIRLTILIQ